MTKLKNQSGQVAIVILLIMVVLLTVGLSLASRTTQEVFLSQQESQSARVFNAAEVGLEDALSQDFDSISAAQPYTDTTTVTDVNINTTINPNHILETTVVEGSAVHIDLRNYNGDFTVSWAKTTVCDANTASILASVYYDDNGTTKVIHEAFGPCTRSPDDQFTISGVSNGSNGYYKQKTVDVPTVTATLKPLFARVRPVYADTAVRITGTIPALFPTQFFVIRSQADNDTGDESRTVEVGRTLSTAPSFMDYSVYSGADISIEAAPTPAP